MLRDLFGEYGIEYFGVIPFSACSVIAENIVTRRGIDIGSLKSAVPFLVPYYVSDGETSNISVYARALDYHLFFEKFYEDAVPRLEREYGARFYGFADKSAISEVHAASIAGLGNIGDSGLILNEKYGAYVFIGELLSSASPEELGFEIKEKYEPSGCIHCGACREKCPMREGLGCLSAVTQKKGELTDAEQSFLLRYGSAWGCDICAAVCPYTKKAMKNGDTPIKFFRENRIAYLSSSDIENMDDETFRSRAFAWRGRKTILRNLELFEKQK